MMARYLWDEEADTGAPSESSTQLAALSVGRRRRDRGVLEKPGNVAARRAGTRRKSTRNSPWSGMVVPNASA
ncbi:MAG: hypothetical protein U5O39_06100 [Gammaproteobacteria bacterium]|nr:hypothetical protein [Gammaproteobacteria bacterium]